MRLLITGGTGSLGHRLAHLASLYGYRQIVIFSRDEKKQEDMSQLFPANGTEFRYFLGDVRDSARLNQALDGVDTVIHAAALKTVTAGEYNPDEFVATNICGTQNVIHAAKANRCRKVMIISSDKACHPVNLYGMTKAVAEKVAIRSNALMGSSGPSINVVRYGNVLGSRGSVVPFWREQMKSGSIDLTHPDMTRFWITLDRAARFVFDRLVGHGRGYIYVPKIASVRMGDLARAMCPNAKVKNIGIRPGEKMHEVLVTEDEVRMALNEGDHICIQPDTPSWNVDKFQPFFGMGMPLKPLERAYSSKTNSFLNVGAIKKVLLDELSGMIT